MTAGDRINHLNSVLMVVSCAAAFVIPFELFLLAYAVLGPLHYLTEISWIHDRSYFVGGDGKTRRPRAMQVWLLLVGLTLAVMIYGLVAERILGVAASPVFEIGLFYLVFVVGALLVFQASRAMAAGMIGLTGIGLFLFSGSPYYGLIGFLILTIIHVLIFTFAFVLLGALKTKSRSGMLSVAIYAACVVAIFAHAPVAPAVSDFVRASYEPFEALNVQLMRLLGLGSGTALRDIYESTAGGTVMRLIAFAYTYHYLNWFTKTSVIGWNRIPRARAVAIVVVWLAAVGIYAWDYLLGFAVLYALSALHVMLELPLNHQSFAGIGRELGRLFTGTPGGVPAPATAAAAASRTSAKSGRNRKR